MNSACVWRLRGLLTVLIVIAFAPFVKAELFWDDHMVITPEGPIASLSTIGEAFFGRCVLFPPHIQYPYYRPLIDILFVLEYAVAGTRPFLYHLTNFLLHLGNGLMAFEVLRRALRIFGSSSADTVAWCAVGLFALHPLQVESVLWPAARPAVLSLFFSLLGALAFMHLIESSRRGGRAIAFGTLAVVGYAAGILSKEVAVALLPPFLLLLVAKESVRRRQVVCTAVAGLVALVLYLLLNSAAASGAEKSTSVGIASLAISGAQTFGFYLRNLAIPLWLFPSYAPATTSHVVYTVVGVAGILLCLAVAGWGIWKRNLPALFAAAGIVLFGGGAVLPLLAGQADPADRYLYQSMLGLAAAAAVGLSMLRIDARRLMVGGCAVCLVLAGLSLRQSLYWTTQESVWSRAVKVDPENLVANYNLALLLEGRGAREQALKHLHVVVFAERADLPERTTAALALGRLLGEARRHDEAIAALAVALRQRAARDEALVLSALVEYSRARPEAARAHLAQMGPPAELSAILLFNLAAIALEHERNRGAAAEYYRLACERGMPPNPQFEAALR